MLAHTPRVNGSEQPLPSAEASLMHSLGQNQNTPGVPRAPSERPRAGALAAPDLMPAGLEGAGLEGRWVLSRVKNGNQNPSAPSPADTPLTLCSYFLLELTPPQASGLNASWHPTETHPPARQMVPTWPNQLGGRVTPPFTSVVLSLRSLLIITSANTLFFLLN